jgi:hypothetical protein
MAILGRSDCLTSLILYVGYYGDMSDKVDQHEMWKQGCRAVFAGFVASAHQRGVSNLTLIGIGDDVTDGSYQQISIYSG